MKQVRTPKMQIKICGRVVITTFRQLLEKSSPSYENLREVLSSESSCLTEEEAASTTTTATTAKHGATRFVN